MISAILTEELVREMLREVIDPELGVNIVDLGLVYGVVIEERTVRVVMTLTTPGCPLHDSLTEAVDRALHLCLPAEIAVVTDLVWAPPWTTDMISPEGQRELGW